MSDYQYSTDAFPLHPWSPLKFQGWTLEIAKKKILKDGFPFRIGQVSYDKFCSHIFGGEENSLILLRWLDPWPLDPLGPRKFF